MARPKEDLSRLSINQMETLTGATFRSIKKWLNDRGLKPLETDDNSILYDPREALPIIFEKLGYKTKSVTPTVLTPEEELKLVNVLDPFIQRARKDRAQASKAEFELEALKKTYVLASEVEQVWANILTGFRMKAMTFSLSISPELVRIENPRDVQNKLDDGLRTLLKELSEYDGDIENATDDLGNDEGNISEGDAQGGSPT